MMEIAYGRFISPALTKPIAITVVALLLWSTAVVSAPASTPKSGFFVRSARMLFIIIARRLLQTFTHHIHSIDKNCQTAKQSENDLNFLVHVNSSLNYFLSSIIFSFP